ncbi:MAG: hypothetical protein RBT63_10355 [Bdellovibrionales bacterium]|jgi:ElaB/YqjD/DUF883 family membrane-anchored ribosome-binding protein|nr:hypothetical protein [Bdellovibrionales bacterium]
MANTEKKDATRDTARSFETLKQAAQDSKEHAQNIAQNITQNLTNDSIKEWAEESTKFIQRNPWTAVAGALVIGYFLGSRSGRGGSR